MKEHLRKLSMLKESTRKRCENYSEPEKDLLLMLVANNLDRIYCTKNDRVSTKVRNDAWEEITAKFNATTTSGERSKENLKTLLKRLRATGYIQSKTARFEDNGSFEDISFKKDVTDSGNYTIENENMEGRGADSESEQKYHPASDYGNYSTRRSSSLSPTNTDTVEVEPEHLEVILTEPTYPATPNYNICRTTESPNFDSLDNSQVKAKKLYQQLLTQSIENGPDKIIYQKIEHEAKMTVISMETENATRKKRILQLEEESMIIDLENKKLEQKIKTIELQIKKKQLAAMT